MNKRKTKTITSNLIFVILIFSIFTSFNNIALEKNNSYAQESKSSSSGSSPLSIKGNMSSEIKQQQQQQQQHSNNLSSFLQNFTFKNITLSHDLTAKINQGSPPKTDNFN